MNTVRIILAVLLLLTLVECIVFLNDKWRR